MVPSRHRHSVEKIKRPRAARCRCRGGRSRAPLHRRRHSRRRRCSSAARSGRRRRSGSWRGSRRFPRPHRAWGRSGGRRRRRSRRGRCCRWCSPGRTDGSNHRRRARRSRSGLPWRTRESLAQSAVGLGQGGSSRHRARGRWSGRCTPPRPSRRRRRRGRRGERDRRGVVVVPAVVEHRQRVGAAVVAVGPGRAAPASRAASASVRSSAGATAHASPSGGHRPGMIDRELGCGQPTRRRVETRQESALGGCGTPGDFPLHVQPARAPRRSSK